MSRQTEIEITQPIIMFESIPFTFEVSPVRIYIYK